MSVLLKQLLSGRLESPFVIINDSLECRGWVVLKAFLEDHSARGNSIHYFAHETLNNTDLARLNGLKMYNCYNEVWDWAESHGLNSFEQAKEILYKDEVEGGFNVIVFDSLSCLIGKYGMYEVCINLNDLLRPNQLNKSSKCQVITVSHTHLTDLESLEYKNVSRLATSVLHLQGSSTDNHQATLQLLHWPPTGKFKSEEYVCSLGSNGQLVYTVKKGKPMEVPEVSEGMELEGITFKLSLGDKEKFQRSKLVLPYQKTSEDEKQGGLIHYQPDEADDWDDEDPDDDLDI